MKNPLFVAFFKKNFNIFAENKSNNMKKLLLPVLLFLSSLGFAQTTEYAFVFFKDKPNKASFYANPLSELTQKSLDRRNNLGIALNDTDAPLENTYVEDVRTTLGLTKVKSKSKWLNGVAVEITPAQKTTLLAKPYVLKIESFAKNTTILKQNKPLETKKKFDDEFIFDDKNFSSDVSAKINALQTTYNYGNADAQITQVNIKPLHINNYTGTGVAIAILDSGFPYVNTGKAYQSLFTGSRVKDVYNFISDNTDVYNTSLHPHGANVLGIIGGYLYAPTASPSTNRYYVGAAPTADFYLYATEDAYGNSGNDYPEEEMNFVMGLERADKMGVDIATASLGYQDFGDDRYDYAYTDMNGVKAFTSRACNFAVDKGIIVMIAQGNNGASTTYKYLNTPADSPKVFSIGAVDSTGASSTFTSYGPNANNVVKPDASARGTSTYYPVSSYTSGTSAAVSFGNGTSYATPIATGGLACILQALPKTTNRTHIKNKMRETASTYPTYDYLKGYGILNFNNALTAISTSTLSTEEIKKIEIKIYPNPTKNSFNISTQDNIQNLELYDESGRKIKDLPISKTQNIDNLNSGIYYIKIKTNNTTQVEKIIKE